MRSCGENVDICSYSSSSGAKSVAFHYKLKLDDEAHSGAGPLCSFHKVAIFLPILVAPCNDILDNIYSHDTLK